MAFLEGIVSDLDALQLCHLPEQLQKLSREAENPRSFYENGRFAFSQHCRRKDELRKISSQGIAGPLATWKPSQSPLMAPKALSIYLSNNLLISKLHSFSIVFPFELRTSFDYDKKDSHLFAKSSGLSSTSPSGVLKSSPCKNKSIQARSLHHHCHNEMPERPDLR